jgi:transposase
MARRNIVMLDLVELFTHWHAGRSQVQLSESLGIDRKTIRKYLAPAIADGIEPGGEPLSAEQWAELSAGWFPALSDLAARASTWPLIAPYRDRIKDWLDADVTVATIAQRLRDDHGVTASESSVRRWIATHFADEVARDRVTVPRGAVEPGSEAQIDYGRLGMWFDPATARRVAVWAFVMVLSCSRHLFVRPVIGWTKLLGVLAMSRRLSSSAGCRPGWCATTSRPGWTSPTCMTRRSTGPMVGWPPTTTR